MGEGDSGGEEPGGVKERDLAETRERRDLGWAVEGLPETAGFGVHRA